MMIKNVLLFVLLLSLTVLAQSDSDLLKEANEAKPWIVDIRRSLHRIPELMYDLPKTTAAVRATLDALKIPYTYPVGKAGIVATVGQGGGSVVGLRADMDALPITEDTGLDFASEHEGRMHACGHDAHTAMLLGAARLLKEREASIGGTVKLVFQPAEEGGGGALDMLKTGQLDDITAMFGFHVWPRLETGMIATRPGVFFGSVNAFSVTVTGNGGHASMPHLVNDPYIPVANMILAYQTVISRRQPPWNANVISVAKIRGGEAFNVIPDSVTFEGTMRSLQVNGLEDVVKEFKSLSEGIAAAYGCKAEVDIPSVGDPVVNNPESTAFAVKTAEKLFKGKVIEAPPTTAAEDFAYYGQKFPSTFIVIGIMNETAGATSNLHTPKFRVDESILPKGAAFHAALAMDYLNGAPLPKTEL